MPDTQLIDQKGIGFLIQSFADIGCTFHEYHREVGIDGLVEIRDEAYKSSGKFFAVQLKSGESFFINEDPETYRVYMDNEHVEYWQKCILPILFIIYSPELNEAFGVKIDKKSLLKTKKQYRINIPKENKINSFTKDDLYSLFYGKIYNDDGQFNEIYRDMVNLSFSQSDGTKTNGLEVFVSGVTDLCNQLYFNTDIFWSVTDHKVFQSKSELTHIQLASEDFYDEYFHILNYHNLIEGDFSFEVETIKERSMTPIFLKPFTLNGRRYLDYLRGQDVEIHDRVIVTAGSSIDPWFYLPKPEKTLDESSADCQ